MKTKEKLTIAENALKEIAYECGAIAEWDGEEPTIEDMEESENAITACQQLAEDALAQLK